MRCRILYLILLLPFGVMGQSYGLKGSVMDEEGRPLSYATAVLLRPADSTLQFYGISNDRGDFSIPQVKEGSYLLQVAFMGYETYYKSLNVPLREGDNLGRIVMQLKRVTLGDVAVVGERIPMKFKKDTVEFDAQSFKTRPDAVAEDLLRRLPGIEVDHVGNIKALGQKVEEVLVDGKPFFGDDPKVATRNLPADALERVQLIDKKSDEVEFTGMDDGYREKVVNLVLKKDRKKGVFGEVEAGYGTDNHYEGSAKLYRFSHKLQLAALGMLNNVNRFGFSFDDYVRFSGGLSALAKGGSAITLGEEGGLPVDFGQPISGLTTSGAGGINCSFSSDAYNRAFLSYLVNGSEKELQEHTTTQHFTASGAYKQVGTVSNLEKRFAHKVHFGVKRRINSLQNFSVNGRLLFVQGVNPSHQWMESTYAGQKINRLTQNADYRSYGLETQLNASWLVKLNPHKTVLKTNVDGTYGGRGMNHAVHNKTLYDHPPLREENQQLQDDLGQTYKASGGVSLLQALGKKYVLIPMLKGGAEKEVFERDYRIIRDSGIGGDSLSGIFNKEHKWIASGVKLRRKGEQSTLVVGIGVQHGMLSNALSGESPLQQHYAFLTPSFTWEYNYWASHRLSALYHSSVMSPPLEMLRPHGDYVNPLYIRYGNPHLKPAVMHRLDLNWLLFDQFSSTSLFMRLNGTYIRDNVSWERSIDEQLVQVLRPINGTGDYTAEGSVDFSTPIRRLGVNVNLYVRETYHRGMSRINEVANINTNLEHHIKLGLDKRKKEQWDISVGGIVEITQSRYSVLHGMNNNYYSYSCFADLSYAPNDFWFFQISGRLNNYASQRFDEPLSVPLINAEVKRFILKNNRLALSLRLFDLLDKNMNLVRKGAVNYLLERRSNAIGRFVMFSLKYRLNRAVSKGGNSLILR
ncbi:MAG: hypothetical protein CSA95_00185 [Bacteroidetes bacterium]|nr:MAG: hypothetical protein CSA95_00185 [Bacteroidota bacterium]